MAKLELDPKTGKIITVGDTTSQLSKAGQLVKPDISKQIVGDILTRKEEPTAPIQEITEIQAPEITQVATQEPTVPKPPEVFDQDALLGNIQSTFDKFGGQAGANEAFIQGVSKFGTGQAATQEQLEGLKGKPLSEVVEQFNIGGALTGFGVAPPTPGEIAKSQSALVKDLQSQGLNPGQIAQVLSEEGLSKQEVDSLLGQIGIGEKPIPITPEEPKKPTSILDQIRTLRTGLTGATAKAVEEAGVVSASEELEKATLNVQDIRNRITQQEFIDEDTLLDLEGQGRGIPAGLIAAQQAKLSKDQQRDLRDLKQDFNNALIIQSIKQGSFNRAERISREIALDTKNDINDEIDFLLDERQIRDDEAQLLRDEADKEFERQADGFILLSPEQAAGIDQTKLISVGDKIYLRPEEKSELELELEQLDLLSTKLGIESQLLKNELIGDDKFQTTTTTADGIFRLTFDKNGNEINRTRIGDAPTGADKITPAQSKSSLFASRVEQADLIIEELAGIGTGFATAFGVKRLPEIFKTEDRKRFQQAEENLITAVLRRESGAAISDSEFVTARLVYMPQPGDGKAVLEQKAKTRKIILDGFIKESGAAFTSAAGVGGVSNTEDLFND